MKQFFSNLESVSSEAVVYSAIPVQLVALKRWKKDVWNAEQSCFHSAVAGPERQVRKQLYLVTED